MRPRLVIVSVLVALLLSSVLGLSPSQASPPELQLTMLVSGNPDNTAQTNLFESADIYLMDIDGSHLRRLTNNTAGDAFASLSPDGKWIVFDSNRNRDTQAIPPEPINTTDLFLMRSDGSEQQLLTRGSTADWSPDGKRIAFHASASGSGALTGPEAGAPTTDSDIFVARIGALLDHGTERTNLTNTPRALEEDADWSPRGDQIVYTRTAVVDTGQPTAHSDIYKMNADGTAQTQLTNTRDYDEEAPEWSPDGNTILFECQSRVPAQPVLYELCTMDRYGNALRQLTNDGQTHLGPHWSPDGKEIVFVRPVTLTNGVRIGQQVFVMNANADGTAGAPTQLTSFIRDNIYARWASPTWGLLRVTAP